MTGDPPSSRCLGVAVKPAPGTAAADKPSPAPTPTAATPVVSASGTTGTRAQAEKGATVGQPTPSSTSGDLASTGVSNAVTYSALGGLLVIAAGGVLVLRGRRRRALHGK
ncbi:LPXTG cell wall anchor domain-containing protein [Streptomyces sp. NPDC058301]|uniref:LPXTG cell wall anchor domain-containing protein n=1 Tax=Streptomyces sp. NPDC058301 TaxID=3346436 RepID=UPI0036E21D1E